MDTLTDTFVFIIQHPVFMLLHELIAIIGLLAIILAMTVFRHHFIALLRQFRQIPAPALNEYATTYHAMSNSPVAQQKFIRNQLGKTVDWTGVVQYLGCLDHALLLNPKIKTANMLSFKSQDLTIPNFTYTAFFDKYQQEGLIDFAVGDVVKVQGILRGANAIEGLSVEKIPNLLEQESNRIWVGLWQGKGSDIVIAEEQDLDNDTLLFNNNMDFRITSKMDGGLEIRGNIWFQMQGNPVIGKFTAQGRVSQYNETFMPINFTVLSVHDSSVQYNSFGAGIFRLQQMADATHMKGYLLSKRPLPEDSTKIALIRVELKKSTRKT